MRRLTLAFVLTATGCTMATTPNAVGNDPSPLSSPGGVTVYPSCVPDTWSPRPEPLPSSPVSMADLSGRWFGSSVEEAPGPLSICNLSPKYLLELNQDGQVLKGKLVLTGFEGRGVFRNPEALQGTVDDGLIKLTGVEDAPEGPITREYELTYHTQTQHLSGLRDGRPFWLVPVVTPSTCPPLPNTCQSTPVP